MSTISNLVAALVARDARQFPNGFSTEDRIRYAERYVLGMLEEALRDNHELRETFELRTRIVEGDLESAQNWEPQ